MRGYRFCYGPQSTNTFNFQWDIINNQSFVLITASEGSEHAEECQMLYDTGSPHRFVGGARFTVDNIAPHNGGVTFHVTIDWPRLLTLWVDIIVFDELVFSIDGFGKIC